MDRTGGARFSYNPDPAKAAEMIGLGLSTALAALEGALDAAKAVTDIENQGGGKPEASVTGHHQRMAQEACERAHEIMRELG